MYRLFLLASVLFIASCQKHYNSFQDDQTFVAQAKKYFSDSVSTSGPALNYRAAQKRTVLWDLATVKDVAGMKLVIAPIAYSDPMLVRTNFTGDFYFHLDYLTNLVISLDSSARFGATVVTLFPDS